MCISYSLVPTHICIYMYLYILMHAQIHECMSNDICMRTWACTPHSLAVAMIVIVNQVIHRNILLPSLDN